MFEHNSKKLFYYTTKTTFTSQDFGGKKLQRNFFYLSAVKTALREIFAVDIFISSLLATVKYAKVYLTAVNTHETKVLRDCEQY